MTDIKEIKPKEQITPKDDPFAFLPETLNESNTANAIIVAPGLHAFFVDDNPQMVTEYAAKGVHFAKRGDKTILNEGLFQDSKTGHLTNGAALIGVIRQSTAEAYNRKLADASRHALNDGAGQMTVTTERS